MIERVSGLSKNGFYKEYVKQSKPVIITDLTKDWPASSLWSEEYFISRFGQASVSTMSVKDEKCDVDTYNETEEGKGNIAEVLKGVSGGLAENIKVIASQLENFPDSIRDDFSAPEYCADGKFLRSRVYIGPAGLVTPLHQDLPENLYVLVKGKKRITLYPPSDRKNLYINSPLSKHPNFSRIDPLHPDFEKYPRSKNARPLSFEMNSGETLFIPSFWWHHIQNIENSMAMNFWWSYDWKMAIAWSAAMYKKWLR